MNSSVQNPWLSRISDAEICRISKHLINNQLNDHDWLLVYNIELFKERLRYLKEHFPNNTLHTLAIKSCPLIAILKIAVNEGFGLEAASLEEVHLALHAGCKGEHIIFDSPVKTNKELAFALDNNICINGDNFDELARIESLISPQNRSKIGLRINPEVGEGDIEMTSVAGSSSKFGVSLSAHKSQIIDSFKRYSWLNGLHIHVGSQGCSLNLLASAAKVIDELKTHINSQYQTQRIEWIDIGGGLPSNYGFDTQAIDVKKYIKAINDLAPQLFEQPLMTENGRSILANCAWAISKIEYLKPHQNTLTAAIHFGADFMMRPVYAAKDWQHQYLVLDHKADISQAPKVLLSIAGPLCFSGDYLLRNTLFPKPNKQDFIVAKDVGAYTISTWSRHCNRRLPKVIAYEGDTITTLFKGESINDVINFWS